MPMKNKSWNSTLGTWRNVVHSTSPRFSPSYSLTLTRAISEKFVETNLQEKQVCSLSSREIPAASSLTCTHTLQKYDVQFRGYLDIKFLIFIFINTTEQQIIRMLTDESFQIQICFKLENSGKLLFKLSFQGMSALLNIGKMKEWLEVKEEQG